MRGEKRRRLRPFRVFIVLAVFIGLIAGTLKTASFAVSHLAGLWSPDAEQMSFSPEAAESVLPELRLSMEGLDIHSRNVLLICRDTQNILLENGGEERIYPASMTKMMTAILALENISDLDVPITLSQEMFAGIYEANASTAGFYPGEEVAALDLIYGTILPSGAEAAVGLAEYISGSEEAFAGLMNEKAAELGMRGTQFTNATGLHDREHYSTAHDMALLLDYALENEIFYKVLTAQRRLTQPTNLHPQGITMHSTLFSKIRDTEEDLLLLGGKTGYTEEAGQCLASLAEIGGKTYILITAGAYGEDPAVPLHIRDAMEIYRACNAQISV